MCTYTYMLDCIMYAYNVTSRTSCPKPPIFIYTYIYIHIYISHILYMHTWHWDIYDHTTYKTKPQLKHTKIPKQRPNILSRSSNYL